MREPRAARELKTTRRPEATIPAVERNARPSAAGRATSDSADSMPPVPTNEPAERLPVRGEEQGSSSISDPNESIRTRAYFLSLERGGAPGSELDDWLQAEREVR